MLLPRRCPICGRSGLAPCGACEAALPAAEPGAPAVFRYDSGARLLVTALKYRNARPVARFLGLQVARVVPPGPYDLVTWPPTSPARARRRGFDQAELLARAVARELGVPCRSVLRRPARSTAQTGRSRSERLTGPVFVARRPVPASVLVVDDVVTTGATLAAAEDALRVAGAVRVVAIAAAATPPHRDERPVSAR